jgi:LPXTG-motif cell wall-anchored protein
MIRKIIVIAFAIVALSAAPAAAQYGEVEGTGTDNTPTASGTASGTDSGSLARTGSDVTVLVPIAAGLLAAGGLALVLVRRRDTSAISV